MRRFEPDNLVTPMRHKGAPGFWQLYAIALATVSIATLGNCVWLFYQSSGGRARGTGLYYPVHLALTRLGIYTSRHLPPAISSYWEFDSWIRFFNFTFVAIAANLVLASLMAAILAPLWLALFRHPEDGTNKHGVASFVASLFLWPLLLPPLFGLSGRILGTKSWGTLAALLAALLLLAALWAVLQWVTGHMQNPKALWAGLITTAAAGVLFVCIGTAFARSQSPGKPVATKMPNVLLVSIDSLRRDHLSAYGYPRETSPNLDRLAREGVLFRDVVSSSSWTLPSHMTLLTGLAPRDHGATMVGKRLTAGSPTLAEIYSRAGYATAALTSGFYLNARHGFSRGFDLYNDYSIGWSETGAGVREITSPSMLQLVEAWLEQWKSNGRERPFFLFVHLWDVHYNYIPPAPFGEMFIKGPVGHLKEQDYMESSRIHRGMAREDLENLIGLYDGEIRYTDYCIGRILDRMKSLGVLENTLIAVTGDHGDEFFEHGNKGHHRTLYDEVVMVPLIMRFQGRIPAGRVVPEQVRLMDVGSTLLSLSGVRDASAFGAAQVNRYHAAHDLSPLILGGDRGELAQLVAFSELYLPWRGKELMSARTSSQKIVTDNSGSVEIYDLKNDPGEQRNLAPQMEVAKLPLFQQLVTWKRARRVSAKPGNLDAEQIRALRSLGYIQ